MSLEAGQPSEVANDQHAFHARFAVTWKLARKSEFARLIEHSRLSHGLARFGFQVKAEGGNKNAVLGLCPAVVEDDRHGMPGRDQDACWRIFELRGIDFDFGGLRAARNHWR